MKKWLLGLPLVLISVFIWLPLWMLISGTFMGGAELSENLAPVLEGRGGTAVWPVMARYPTLAAYVELLLDTPQFFTVFWRHGHLQSFIFAGKRYSIPCILS